MCAVAKMCTNASPIYHWPAVAQLFYVAMHLGMLEMVHGESTVLGSRCTLPLPHTHIPTATATRELSSQTGENPISRVAHRVFDVVRAFSMGSYPEAGLLVTVKKKKGVY